MAKKVEPDRNGKTENVAGSNVPYNFILPTNPKTNRVPVTALAATKNTDQVSLNAALKILYDWYVLWARFGFLNSGTEF